MTRDDWGGVPAGSPPGLKDNSGGQAASPHITELEVDKVPIALNSSTFDAFVEELQPDIVMFDRYATSRIKIHAYWGGGGGLLPRANKVWENFFRKLGGLFLPAG